MQIINQTNKTFTTPKVNAESSINAVVSEANKEFTSNQTKFKMCVYWSHKPCGTPYSVYEKQMRQNRRYIPSYDYTQGAAGYNITDHSKALDKLLLKMKRNKKHIEKAIIIMNDWKNRQELRIGEFPGGEFQEGDFVAPIFYVPNEKGHVYVKCLPRDPLQVDAMRTQNFQYRQLKKF